MSINIEGIADFIREHSKVVILSTGIVLVCLLIILIASLSISGKSEKPEPQSGMNAIAPEEFFFPDEPLATPGIQLSRDREAAWSEEEAERWFVAPSKEDLDEMRRLGEESVNRLLEAVP